MAKAVVSTTIGAEGLPVHHGQDLMLADSPDDFAQNVVQLLQHATTRRSLGLAARELVESKYSWASVAREFAAALASINEHSLMKNR